jgi:hypothetical protein
MISEFLHHSNAVVNDAVVDNMTSTLTSLPRRRELFLIHEKRRTLCVRTAAVVQLKEMRGTTTLRGGDRAHPCRCKSGRPRVSPHVRNGTESGKRNGTMHYTELGPNLFGHPSEGTLQVLRVRLSDDDDERLQLVLRVQNELCM